MTVLMLEICYQYLYKQQGMKPFRTLQHQFLLSWIWNGENDKAQQVIGSTKESWFLHKENDFKKTKNRTYAPCR